MALVPRAIGCCIVEMMRGFTLMEIMIAVAVMAIISGVGLTSFNFSLQKSRDSQRKSDLVLIAKAVQSYAGDFGFFPADDGEGNIMGCYDGSANHQKCTWGQAFLVYLGGAQQAYLAKIPYDPNGKYYYHYEKNGETGFSLFSVLENTKDAFYRVDAGEDYGAGTIFCGSPAVMCNYEYTEGGAK